MGPLVTASASRKRELVYRRRRRTKARRSLSTAAAAGRGDAKGFFLGAALFDNVTPDDVRSIAKRSSGRCSRSCAAKTYDEALATRERAIRSRNGVAIFTNDGGAARAFQSEVQVGMVGINVPIPVPMAYHSFGGWKASLFGDAHVHGAGGREVLHARQDRHVALARPRVARQKSWIPHRRLARPASRCVSDRPA